MSSHVEISATIPPEFRTLLLELVVAYLIDQPPDFLDFAIDYLKKKKDERIGKRRPKTPTVLEPEEEGSSVSGFAEARERRKSVFAERYDPEEEAEFKPPVYEKDKREKRKMMEAMKNVVLFQSLDHRQKEELADAMMKREVSAGEELIKQGEEGDFFYIVEKGAYEAWKDGTRLLKKYHNSGSFGELALMYNVPRYCTVRAVTDGRVWTLDRQTFRKIVVTSAFKKRKMYEELIDSVPLLGDLNEVERTALADALVPLNYRPGERIIKQGEVADGMYFIEEGRVRVTVREKDDLEEETDVKILQPGDYFGEMALLTSRPRAASVYAVDRVRLAYLEVDAFERLLGSCMDIMKRNIETYEQQLNQLFGKSIIDPAEIRHLSQ